MHQKSEEKLMCKVKELGLYSCFDAVVIFKPHLYIRPIKRMIEVF
jgi:hypothetical protein